MPSKSGRGDEIEVRFSRQQASQAADRVFHATFLPRAVRIAEKGLNAEDLVKSVVLGEFVSVVEADGSTHCLRQFAELTSDGSSSGSSFSIDRTVNHAEAGLPFVENQQTLSTSGEQHKIGLPMARRLAAFGLSGSFGDRAPLFDEAAGAAAYSSTPSYFLVARQQTIPVILLGRAMIDETID